MEEESVKEILRINFCDFWNHFNPMDNYFYRLLAMDFRIEISDDPDFLIYSCYGEEHLNFDCYKIYYSGENQKINWNACDIALGFEESTKLLYRRLPNWIWYTT